MVETKFSTVPITHYIGIWFVVIFVVFCIWILAAESVFGIQYEDYSLQTRQNTAGGLVAFISLIYVYLARRRCKSIHIWHLNGDVMSRGEPVNFTFNLSTIESAIQGMPNPSGLNKFNMDYIRFKHPSAKAMLDDMYKKTLVLKLDKSTYLPLYLFHIGNGQAIMKEILEKVSSKVEPEHRFNDTEKNVLNHKKLNKLIKIKD